MSELPSTLRDYDPEELPREKAEKYGCHILTPAELLAIILRVGTQGHPIMRLTRELLGANGNSLHRLMRRSRGELLAIPGIGLTKAIQVEAIMALIRKYVEEEEEGDRRQPIKTSRDIFREMRFRNCNASQEEIWVLTLNRRNVVIGAHHVTTGSAVASVFDIKRILKIALLDEACGIILCHNHPSGNLRPSIQDDRITESLKSACATMDLRMLDHVIVTADAYYSYADEGRL